MSLKCTFMLLSLILRHSIKHASLFIKNTQVNNCNGQIINAEWYNTSFCPNNNKMLLLKAIKSLLLTVTTTLTINPNQLHRNYSIINYYYFGIMMSNFFASHSIFSALKHSPSKKGKRDSIKKRTTSEKDIAEPVSPGPTNGQGKSYQGSFKKSKQYFGFSTLS